MAVIATPFNAKGVGMRKMGMLLAILLAGCSVGDGVASDDNDGFAPGEWQAESWMESSQGSTRGTPAAGKIETVMLSEKQSKMPPAAVFFTHFYHGVREGDVRFTDGKVEGTFESPGMDDISAATVPVSGTYARDKFHLTFTFKALGMEGHQIVDGRLVAPSR